MFGITAPTAMKRRIDSARAAPLATKPRSCAALMTASYLSARTPADPLNTRETVEVETPARRATSRATGNRSALSCGTVGSFDKRGELLLAAKRAARL